MAKDIITEEEWEFEEVKRPAAPIKRPSQGGGGSGGGTSLKDYAIVALIAIIAVMGINNFIYARTGPTGGFGGGGGGCCGSGGGAVAGLSNAELEVLGLQYYFENTGDVDVDSVTAQVQDFGCHQEIYIYKDGQQVMRVGYGNGQVYEI